MPNALMSAAGGTDTSSYGSDNTNQLLAAASNTPQVANQWLANAQGQQQLSADQYKLASQKFETLNGIIGGIASDPSPDNANQQVMNGIRMGVISASDGTREMQNIAQMSAGQQDTSQPNPAIKAHAYQHLSQNFTTQQQMDAAYGSPSTVNTGGQINPVVVKSGPNAGVYPAGGSPMATTLTPSDKTVRVNSVDPSTGAQVSQSVGQLYDAQGNFKSIPVTRGGAGATQPQTAQPPQTPQPAAPGAAQPPAAAMTPPVAGLPSTASAGAPAGALTTALSPGAKLGFENSASSWRDLASDVASPSGVNQRVYMLDQALGALRNTNTGLGTAGRQKIQSYLAALPGGIGQWAAGDPSKLSDFDLANKYLTAYSLNTPGAARSDAGSDKASAANASVSINPKAAQEVTLSNIGLERMKQAQANAFIQSQQDPGGYTNWSAKWGQNVDPKAFALGSMTPQERTQYFSGLKGSQLSTFRNTVRKGIATGVLTRDDLAGAPNGQ